MPINAPSYPRNPEAVLLVELDPDQQPVWIGHVDSGLPKYAQIIVRKTSSDQIGSHFVGVKIMLRCDTEQTLLIGDEPDSYLDISIIINPKSCNLSHRQATTRDRSYLARIAPNRDLGQLFAQQPLHLIKLTPTDKEAFFYKPAEAPLQTSNPFVRQAYEALEMINEAKKVWLFLYEAKNLTLQLNLIVKNKHDNPRTPVSRFSFWKYPSPLCPKNMHDFFN